MDITLNDQLLIVKVVTDDDGYIESQKVEAILLYKLLEKLEEIRCGLIDIEGGVEELKGKN